jgi:hypothetical protein
VKLGMKVGVVILPAIYNAKEIATSTWNPKRVRSTIKRDEGYFSAVDVAELSPRKRSVSYEGQLLGEQTQLPAHGTHIHRKCTPSDQCCWLYH